MTPFFFVCLKQENNNRTLESWVHKRLVVMAEIICCNCKKPFDETGLIQCPHCDAPIGEITVFQKLIQKDETETKKIVSQRIGTRSSKGAEDMLNLEEEGCDVEFRYRMNKGRNYTKGSFSEKLFKLLLLLFFSCTPSTLFAYSYVQVEGYLAADSVYNTAWKRKVPIYIIPYDISSIRVYPEPFISGYGAHISKLSLQGDNGGKIIDLTGNISFYNIDMSKVPFNYNCFLYITAVSGYNPEAIDEICYIRRIARDNPSHQQLRLSVSTTTSRYWECSKDGGTTWNVLPNSNKTYYTEENPEKGTALYRVLKEDGNYSDILTINYYDIVPSNIVASPSTITKTVDESTTFSVNVEDDGYTYQWMHNGIAIEGATSQQYTIENIKAKDAGNYYCVVSNPVSSTNSSIVSLSVNKASQTIVFPTIEDKIYGDNPFTLTATSNRNLPIAYTSSNPSVISINGNTATIKGAGSTTLTAYQEGTSNYESSQSVISVTINKAPLVLKADDKERIYGEGNPSFTISFDGFKNGDTKEDLYTLPNAYCEASATTSIGQYDIVISEVTDNNYEIQYQKGKLTISKAPLTVKAENAEKEYGERNPIFRIVYQGFKNEESEVVLLNKPSVYTTAKTMSEVGVYPIIVEGGEARNYYFVYEESILQITKAPLTVILFDVEREYGEEKTAEIRYVSFKGDDSVGNLDVLPTVKTSANIYTSVGTYEMILSGGADNNYDYVFDYNGKPHADITIYKAPLMVKADDKVYSLNGGLFPNFSMSFDGFRNNDTKEDIDEWPCIYCEADSTYPEGEYVIVLSGGHDNNYNLILQNGILTISAYSTAIIDIEKDNQSSEVRIYNIFGQFVRNITATDFSQLSNILPSGVYIINGKKYYIK